MNNVVIICLDGKEMLFKNARFIVKYDSQSIVIHAIGNDNIVAIFNFNNVIGVKMI